MYHRNRRFRFIVELGCVLLGLLIGLAQGAVADGIVPGHVLVRVKAGVDPTAVAATYRLTVIDQVSNTALYSFRVPVGKEQKIARTLQADARVTYAEPDIFLENPEFDGTRYHFAFDGGKNAGGYINQAAYTMVHIGKTWQLTTGAGVTVAVLDTGATFTHPALKGHYLPGYNVLSPDLPPTDDADGETNVAQGHGTMIAGIIARLAPKAKILPVRVMNADGVGTMLDVAKGLHYAVTHGARVINMSFGATKLTSAMKDALDEAEQAGVVLVAAAGNDGLEQVQYPAAGHGAVAVGSIETDKKKSDYSNYGSFIRVVAPGTGIRSAYFTGGYADWSGTSFSTPFVSAEAALMFAYRPALTKDTVVSTIRKTAHSVDSQNPAYKGRLGNGIIDIEAAVKRVK